MRAPRGRRPGRRTLAAVGLSIVLFAAPWIVFPLPIDKLDPVGSMQVVDRDGELLRAYLAPDEMWRFPLEADGISDVLRDVVIAYEDRRFLRHPGVDPVAIVRAAVANLRARRVVQGGSTITMQVARLIEPKRRSVTGKLVEAFRAVQLEQRFSKDEILTHYLNLAPYGGNLVGIGAAARHYFGKRPEGLSLAEVALLAAIPRDPNRNRPDADAGAAREARDRVLRLLEVRGVISHAQLAEALTEPVPDRRRELPFLAPHLADLLARGRVGGVIVTTIDHRLQELSEEMLRAHLAPMAAHDIHNGAVVIMNNATRSVLALVGSRAFFDEAHDGQVNGAMAPRSPGSALKPFVYALAFDRGVAAPRTLVEDIPVIYGGYRPQNYDRRFRGLIPAEEALVQSLNVPAVNLTAELGPGAVHHFLERGGLSTLDRPTDDYGLSMALGGCEVTLVELTTLYAALADGGRYLRYRTLAADPGSEAVPLVGPGTAFLVTEILSRVRRPELPASWESTVGMPKVAWKTGTSYAHRDAWSIGYTPRYTVGVWIGNMDGHGARALVGAETAAPLLFALLEQLETNPSDGWFTEPPDVRRRRVCALTGQPATELCPSTCEERVVAGRAPVEPCEVHRRISIDVATGHRLCSRCRIGRECEESVVAEWPPRLASWLARNGHVLDAIPDHLPDCSRLTNGYDPVIHSPQPGSEFRLRRGVPAEQQRILLDASVTNRSGRIFWFVNGDMVFSGAPGERVFMTPRPGLHTLLCMDDEGRSAEVRITVR